MYTLLSNALSHFLSRLMSCIDYWQLTKQYVCNVIVYSLLFVTSVNRDHLKSLSVDTRIILKWLLTLLPPEILMVPEFLTYPLLHNK